MTHDRISTSFYKASISGAYAGAIALGVVAYFAGSIKDAVPSDALTMWVAGALAAVLFVYATVFQYILWYKAWSLIQDGQARTSPGRAVGFALIPAFNVVWLFELVWGFAKDYNAYLSRHRLSSPRLSEGFFLALPIFAVVAAVVRGFLFAIGAQPGLRLAVTMGCVLALYGFVAAIVEQLCNALNSLPEG